MNGNLFGLTKSLADPVTHRAAQKKFGPVLAGLALSISLSATQPANGASFRFTGAMHSARDGHTATLLPNGKVLVAGGGVMTTNELSSAELYDPASGTWTLTGSMNAIRWGHTATLLTNGLVLVAGGSEGVGVPYAELYDPESVTWHGTVPMTRYRFFHTATLLTNGQVLLAGGDYSGATAELYDPVTETWSPTGPMIEIRFGHTATLLPNGQVLVAGGYDYNDPGSVSFTAELYDPISNTWTVTGEMSDNRAEHTATLLTNGLVLVAGGYQYGLFEVSLPSAELYDPASGTWADTGWMVSSSPATGLIGRFAHTATLLANGQVLITGGEYRGFVIGKLYFAELYNPATEIWTATGRLIANREYHTATLLPSGEVLVAGGYFYAANIDLPSAERYGVLPTATMLTAPTKLADASFQFSFTNNPGVVSSVQATTNVALPFNDWAVLGAVKEVSPGQFLFTDTQATNYPQRFYRLRSP